MSNPSVANYSINGRSQDVGEWGPYCTRPPTTGLFGRTTENRGRSQLYAAYDGSVYQVFVNQSNFDDPAAIAYQTLTRRTWIERLTNKPGRPRFLKCIDETTTTLLTSQGYVDPGDPDMVVDQVSDTIAVGYSAGVGGHHRIMLATSSASDVHTWVKQQVWDPQFSGDQGHPAIALTQFDNPNDSTQGLDRLASGMIYLTWYDPRANADALKPYRGQVQRMARGYTLSIGNAFVPKSDAFAIGGTFYPIDQDVGWTGGDTLRGVHEYEGAAHFPGIGGWIGVWGQQTPVGTSNPHAPSDSDIGLVYNIWP